MKKILHVVGAMNIGGTENMLMNIYRNIDRERVQFDFISYSANEGYYDEEIRKLGGRIIHLSLPRDVGSFRTIRELYKVIRHYGPYEAVHCHTLFNCGLAVLAAYMCKVKVRISHSHTTLDEQSTIFRKIYITFMRVLMGWFSTNFMACSNSAGNYLFSRKIIKGDKYTYLPNYIDYKNIVDNDNFRKIKEELHITDDEKIVGHIGRFMDAKNHDFLIDVIANMISKDNKIRGLLVGDGALRQKMELKVRLMGLDKKINFIGLRSDIPEILNSMDIFIFPSIYEGLGLVLLEAQASGLPCLVSEAIQPEADLGIGLINKMDLSEGADKWAERALECVGRSGVDKSTIIRGFNEKGYTLQCILSKLSNIYKIEDMGKLYERNINSIF